MLKYYMRGHFLREIKGQEAGRSSLYFQNMYPIKKKIKNLSKDLLISLNNVFIVSIIKHNREREKVKRVQVTFTEKQWKLLEMFRGVMGNEDAEIVRNIILAWLAEKSVVTSSTKEAIYIRQQGST
jgi:hypothetical protein